MIDTQQHFKIWFNKNPNEWMPLANQLRLIRHRHRNPEHTLYLVGADRLLSPEAIKQREKFCAQHNINYLDIDLDIPRMIEENGDSAKQEKDRQLLAITNGQLDAYFKVDKPNLPLYGNIAAASDALRWLSVLLDKAIYSDLDTEIDFQNAPTMIEKAFLMPCRDVWEGIEINNNFIAASPDSEIAEAIREGLIENSKKFYDWYHQPLKWVSQLYGPAKIREIIRKKYFIMSPSEMWQLSEDACIEQYRKIIEDISVQKLNLFKDNRVHNQDAGDMSWAENTQEIKSQQYKDAAELILQTYQERKKAKLNASFQLNKDEDKAKVENSELNLGEADSKSVIELSTANSTPLFFNKQAITESQFVNINSSFHHEQNDKINTLIAKLQKEINSCWPYPHKERKQVKVDALLELLELSKTYTVKETIERVKEKYQAKGLLEGSMSTRTKDLFSELESCNNLSYK